jgi:hypothetical protein
MILVSATFEEFAQTHFPADSMHFLKALPEMAGGFGMSEKNKKEHVYQRKSIHLRYLNRFRNGYPTIGHPGISFDFG